jgi:hypothetical protein
MTRKTKVNPDNDLLTVRIGEIKKEMIDFANKHDVSLAYLVKRGWKLLKKAHDDGKLEL